MKSMKLYFFQFEINKGIILYFCVQLETKKDKIGKYIFFFLLFVMNFYKKNNVV